jgi:hypothetical protein
MNKAGPTNALSAANIGMPAGESPRKCSHGKRRVMRSPAPPAGPGARRCAAIHRYSLEKQTLIWLPIGEENRTDLNQIDRKTPRFEFV